MEKQRVEDKTFGNTVSDCFAKAIVIAASYKTG